MIAQGQLQANSEAQLQHAPLKGSVYSPTHPQPIQAQSDYQISVGQYTLPTDVYRLPSAEYTALVRGSPNYQQSPRLAELLHLTAQHHVDYEWLPAGPMGQKPLGFLPQENSFTATWDSWRWACLERSGEWFLVMWFHLNFLDPGYKVFATEVALDLGADPLVCAAEPGAVVYSVTPATLTPTAEVEQLLTAHPELAERVQYELQRATLLRFTFFLVHHSTVVYAEDLTYRDMDRNFVRWARRSGLIDWHESWLHNRLAAAGVPFEKVDSRGTSCRCSSCEWPHGHRQSADFTCPKCGVQMNVHENAARNILARGQVKAREWQQAHNQTRMKRGRV
ncbi:zinc ribbon domain-containing protein [Deinococcus antarcticus]|uniref:Zinc ribbon domain-containing protein n=1 Tax=Deinococcus antarcticus TaxID=1298767 RepID=A0ABV8AEK6_9DEIO